MALTDDELIENLRRVANGTITAIADDPEQIAALRAGTLRVAITKDGVFRERLIPHPDSEPPSPN